MYIFDFLVFFRNSKIVSMLEIEKISNIHARWAKTEISFF